MGYVVDKNAKNVWVRDNADTEDLSVQTSASAVYFNNGRTMEQEFGKGSMVSNVTTVESRMDKVIDGTYDGAYESCKMYGRSLVNLFNSKQITPSLHFSSNNDGKYENIVKSNGLIEFDIVGSENPGNYQYINMGKVNVDLLKPNTRYLVLFEEITGIDTVSIRDGNSANTVIDYTKVGGKQYVILTTLSEWQKSNQILYLYVQSKTGIHVKVKNAMIIEYQEGMENWDLDYFERLCDVKAPILQNVGKNLFNIANHTENQWTFSNGYPHEQVKTYEDRLKILNNEIHFTTDGTNVNKGVGYYVPLCKNKDYTLNINKKSGNNFCVKVFLIHPSEKPLRQYIHDISRMPVNSEVINTKTFKANFNSTNYEMCAIYIGGGGWENGATGTRSFVFNNISLTQSSDNTTHEPYKTNILETSDEVILRGLPNGVRDTYDCLTGEYIRRVGEIVLDGSQAINNDGDLFYINVQDEVENNVTVSDTLPSITVNQLLDGNEGVAIQNRGDYGRLYINIKGLSTREEITQRLQTTPVKVHYGLVEPVITHIEPSTIPFAYEDGHILLESGHEGSLLPTLEYQTIINRTGQIAMIDKTIQQHGKKITMLEKMLIQNIIDIEYKNTLLSLKLEMNEVI